MHVPSKAKGTTERTLVRPSEACARKRQQRETQCLGARTQEDRIHRSCLMSPEPFCSALDSKQYYSLTATSIKRGHMTRGYCGVMMLLMLLLLQIYTYLQHKHCNKH